MLCRVSTTIDTMPILGASFKLHEFVFLSLFLLEFRNVKGGVLLCTAYKLLDEQNIESEAAMRAYLDRINISLVQEGEKPPEVTACLILCSNENSMVCGTSRIFYSSKIPWHILPFCIVHILHILLISFLPWLIIVAHPPRWSPSLSRAFCLW